MSNDDEKRQFSKARGPLDKFEPGGELGPIEDRNQYEQRFDSLPVDQKELARESTRFADLCQYFCQHEIDIPPQIQERVGRLPKLALSERIRAVRDINRALMEYLNDVGQDSGIRQ
jgi:hypothetical protein